MTEVIRTEIDRCTGCNRCVRECPMELANKTYREKNGEIKVIIDYDKCIICGRCVSACKHEARSYTDDTERFFGDLAKGERISIIVAPSVRTNIPEYKRLFTYLKRLGVNSICDVSLGADICTWAHVRHMERNEDARIITQPCPAIVIFCQMYHPELLSKLSPVHSPMACTAVFMREYKGITDKIAAISPCMAKKIEFEDTGLVQYNVTIGKLLKYLEENDIELPDEETGFDHDPVGMGSLYPMPGGFTENIEFFADKRMHIAKAEGDNVYDRLFEYTAMPDDLLPDIYDVLNCAEGCNIGTAGADDRCVFEIGKTMDKNRREKVYINTKDHYKELYLTYDKTLDPSLFTRVYAPIPTTFPQITDEDIGKAFESMGKDSYEKLHVDCGACGSDTCHDMARKIALDVNIPANCIIKSKDDAKAEHEEYLLATAANRAKSIFLSHISHEIRTPINAVLGTAEMQLQKDELPPEFEEAFSHIHNSGKLLLTIINDLLDLSKIEAGKLQLTPNEYDMPSLIYDTMQLNLLRYESKYIEFNLKIDKNTPHDMFGDELRIKQILNNILSNAFKYTDDGEVELSVWAETKEDDPECTLVFRISDTGQGMTEEQIAVLFEEYTRFNLDINRTTVGTGLGMTITKRLLDLMNGDIQVKSKPDKGTTFTVRLPQERVGEAVCGIEMADKLRSNRFQGMSKSRRAKITHEYMPYGSILVVDDVDSNLYVAKGMMIPYGLKIETAVSGFEAVEKIKEGHTYDIIFTDHMMPKMDGIEAAKIIRGLGYREPIVALTANAVTGQADVFMENGFDGFISKPIDMRELNLFLNRLIRDKQPPEVIKAARQKTGSNKLVSLTRRELPESEFLRTALQDIHSAIFVLEMLLPKVNDFDEDDLKLYITTVHGMKSVLIHIGEPDLSTQAYKLEKAGTANNLKAVRAETPAFIEAVKNAVSDQSPMSHETSETITIDEIAILHEHLAEIRKACSRIKKSAARASLDVLRQIAWPQGVNDLLEEISAYLLHGEFKKAINAVDITANLYKDI
ncbi:MAG: ATP-binding protein [Defluviitaleaceae bacterium]|nr:ATP-binding protein [Defluviitaleaceae bacterium]